MRVLVIGATGFLGRHISTQLLARGDEVVVGARRKAVAAQLFPRCRAVEIDLADEHSLLAVKDELRGIDVVINAAGVFASSPGNEMGQVHAQGPALLFELCVEAQVGRIVHISALGTDCQTATRYHQSKRQAERALAALPVEWVILRPSLVIGEDGASWRLFQALSLLWPLPGLADNDEQLQPVGLDDVVAAALQATDRSEAVRQTVDLVSAEAMTLADYLQQVRSYLGASKGLVMAVPVQMLAWLTPLARLKPNMPLTPEAVQMLQHANKRYATDSCRRALGFVPCGLADYLAAHPASRQQRLAARLYFLGPLLRLALGLLWIGSGVTSLWLYPLDNSLALLGQIGLQGPWAQAALWSAGALDIALGLWVLSGWHPRLAALAQVATVLTYTAILTIFLPALWLHPFAPIGKNLPIVVAVLIGAILEQDN